MEVNKMELLENLKNYKAGEIKISDSKRLNFYNFNFFECELQEKNKKGKFEIVQQFKPNKDINKLLEALEILFDVEFI